MPKYFMTWEVNVNRIPTNQKESGIMGIKLVEILKHSKKTGKLMDWGAFIGGDRGYAIFESSATELYKELHKYSPYVQFHVQEVLSIDDVLETFHSMIE